MKFTFHLLPYLYVDKAAFSASDSKKAYCSVLPVFNKSMKTDTNLIIEYRTTFSNVGYTWLCYVTF